jgi:hypothetical protein
MSDVVTICTFCNTVFLYDGDPDEECPECEVGLLVDLDEYNENMKELEDNDRENHS